MLQTRRAAARLAQRPYLVQRRGYADTKPSGPTNSVRGVDDQPVSESIAGSDSSGTDSLHATSAGGHEPTIHPQYPEPKNEDIGRGFYISIAALALSFAVYEFSRRSSNDPATAGDPSTQPIITRWLQYYSWWQDDFARRNTLHTKAVEQAGADRNLFHNSPWTHHIDLKFPEVFNTGSPYNIPAGASADLDHLRAHYEKLNVEAEEKRIARLKAQEGDSAILAQREAETLGERQPKGALEWLGLKKPGG